MLRHHLKYFAGHVGLKINYFSLLHFYMFRVGARKNAHNAFACIDPGIHACQAYDLRLLAPHYIVNNADPRY